MNLQIRLAHLAVAALMSALINPLPSVAATDEVADGQWFHGFLRTAEAHKTSDGAGVKVAVIDTGVDATHPDLSGSVLPGADFSPEGPSKGTVDKDGHGTGMASLIAGHGRVMGIAPGAKVVPIRQSIHGRGATADIARSIEWAVAQGDIQIISISLADGFDDPSVRTAVKAALDADIVVVAGVGNDPQQPVGYPAAIPGVVAVSGVDRNGQNSKASATGSAVVISAPSDGITSASLSHLWQIGTGTSAATAIVAGAATLVRATHPELSAAEVFHRLTATATDKGPPGRDSAYGHGLLNLVAALTADVAPIGPDSPSSTENAPSTPANRTALALIVGAVAMLGMLVLLILRSRRRR
ncbi:S8 family serine peptidase [Catellatospora coxensis]|uniref:Type VII secretion-associated serine protease n=1 Tax=Catellatospora coxensis TaxID=310354 RepID=A0A8J3KR07_9ACTN|nr:S8 family serine peptidase [Catellatospora coxensis]GIG04522.1 type VII secretion-associated serine protease [Catellatospora coxensis]